MISSLTVSLVSKPFVTSMLVSSCTIITVVPIVLVGKQLQIELRFMAVFATCSTTQTCITTYDVGTRSTMKVSTILYPCKTPVL